MVPPEYRLQISFWVPRAAVVYTHKSDSDLAVPGEAVHEGTVTSSFRDAQICSCMLHMWTQMMAINPPEYKVTAGKAQERRAEPHMDTLKLMWGINVPISLTGLRGVTPGRAE